MGSGPIVFTNGKFLLGANDLSGLLRKGTLNISSVMVDATVMGDSAERSIGGLQKWQLDAQLRQDFTCVDGALNGLVGTTVCFAIAALNTCIGSTNRQFSAIGILEKYDPINGGVGKLLEPMITIRPFGASISVASSS